MTKLTEKEREGFENIMKQDLEAIDVKFMNQIKDFWGIARNAVMKERGLDNLVIRKLEIEKEEEKLKEERHNIERTLKSEPLRPEQSVEMGGQANNYGEFRKANFYGIPVDSQFDYEIVEYIRTHVDLDIPSKSLRDLGRSCLRELAMSGTFEEAREAYKKFYSMNFRKYGVDIPPRLGELKNDIDLKNTKEVLFLQQNDKGTLAIEERR